MRRSLIGAAVLTALAAPPAADAAGPKVARFVAYASGKQVTTWDVPRYDTYRDCQGQRWHEASGKETVRFTTKPVRIVAVQYPSASAPQVSYGKWSTTAPSRGYGLPGSGSITRTGREVDGIEPSVCHDLGDPTETDGGPYDCGRHDYEPQVSLTWSPTRLAVEAVELTLAPDFDNCPVVAPAGASAGDWTTIDARFPARELFDASRGLVEARGRRRWTEAIQSGHGTATTVTRFKVRLRRAK